MKKKFLLALFVVAPFGLCCAQYNTVTATNISSYNEGQAAASDSTAVVEQSSDSANTTETVAEEPVLVSDTVVSESYELSLDTLIDQETGEEIYELVESSEYEESVTTTQDDTPKKAKKEKVKREKYGVETNHWSIAGHVGVGFIDGDQHQNYNDMWPRSKVDCSFDFMVEYTVNPGFGIFLEYAYMPYNGDANYYFKGQKDNNGLQRNLTFPYSFDGLSHEVSAGFSLNMLNMFYANRRQTWGLYLNAGAGFAFYDVKAYEQGTKNLINKTLDGVEFGEGKGTPFVSKGRAVTFPIGAMVEYNPLRWLAIALNIEYRLHAKDNFDGVEKGNANDNAIYMSLGLRWKINNPKYKEREHVRNASLGTYLKNALGSGNGAACCDQVSQNTKKIAELEKMIANIKCCDSTEVNNNPSTVIIENEPDDDHDGVPNSRDRELDTPEGSFVNTWGEAMDQSSIERILGYGQYKGEIPAIYFQTGKATMSLRSQMELAKIARKLYADPALKLDIVGYCDNVGSTDVNNTLSIRRAEEAKNILVTRYGVGEERIATYGKGKTPGPVDDFEPNRRCDFIMYNEKDRTE